MASEGNAGREIPSERGRKPDLEFCSLLQRLLKVESDEPEEDFYSVLGWAEKMGKSRSATSALLHRALKKGLVEQREYLINGHRTKYYKEIK